MWLFPSNLGPILPLSFQSSINYRNEAVYETLRSGDEAMGRVVRNPKNGTPDQTLDLQVGELKATGCIMIFAERISKAGAESQGLGECLKR